MVEGGEEDVRADIYGSVKNESVEALPNVVFKTIEYIDRNEYMFWKQVEIF